MRMFKHTRRPGRMTRTFNLLKFGLLLMIVLTSHAGRTGADEPIVEPSLESIARPAQQRVVKIYGAGGIRSLESYQSGFLVSPDGHIATAWSYVLNVPPVVQLDDGARYEASVVAFEPQLELAVLKIDADGVGELPYFQFGDDEVRWGDPVLAISNLFNIATGNEPASVMSGRVAAVTPLSARRGTFETTYRGEVVLLDLVANNPGAAGGAVISPEGQLIGMLGKELRDTRTGVWINYALPAQTLREAVGDIIAGRKRTPPIDKDPLLARDKSHNLESLGLVMVPNVLEATPAFVDAIRPDTPAAAADIRPDDLILMLGGARVDHQQTLMDGLRRIDRRDPVDLTLQRGNNIVTARLKP